MSSILHRSVFTGRAGWRGCCRPHWLGALIGYQVFYQELLTPALSASFGARC